MLSWHNLKILLLILLIINLVTKANKVTFSQVYFQIGSNIGHRVHQQILHYFSRIQNVDVIELPHNTNIVEVLQLQNISISKNDSQTLILSFGDANISRQLIDPVRLSTLPPESYRIKSIMESSYYIMACNGLPLNPHTHTNISFDKLRVHYGAVLSSYACLEKLGFAFLHPLEAYVPSRLQLQHDQCDPSPSSDMDTNHNLTCNQNTVCLYDITESPYWPERVFHIHTQHPLELNEVLQGHDIPQFGPHGPHCSFFSEFHFRNDHNLKINQNMPYCERWEDMVADVNKLFEWVVANRLNKLEWILLGENFTEPALLPDLRSLM
jgi:hypothetical protein